MFEALRLKQRSSILCKPFIFYSHHKQALWKIFCRESHSSVTVLYSYLVLAIQEIINFLHHASYGATYATSMSLPVTQMAISTLKIIMGEDGSNESKI